MMEQDFVPSARPAGQLLLRGHPGDCPLAHPAVPSHPSPPLRLPRPRMDGPKAHCPAS